MGRTVAVDIGAAHLFHWRAVAQAVKPSVGILYGAMEGRAREELRSASESVDSDHVWWRLLTRVVAQTYKAAGSQQWTPGGTGSREQHTSSRRSQIMAKHRAVDTRAEVQAGNKLLAAAALWAGDKPGPGEGLFTVT